MSKRSANGDGTLRERKDGRWEYRVVVGYDEIQKPIRKSFYGKNQTEAKKKYREWLQKPEKVRIEKAATVGEWAAVWLDVYKKDKVEYGTYRNYKMYVDKHIIPSIGKLKLEDVKPAHIEKLMKKASSLSRSAQQHIKIALNGIFETAMDNHLCSTNPARKVTLKKMPKKEPEVFTASEISKILSTAPAVKDGYIVELLLYTGMRIGEAAALQWVDIDRENGIIYIRRSVARKDGGGYEVKSTKSGMERQIGITDKLSRLLGTIPRNSLYVLGTDAGTIPNTFELSKRYMAAISAINAILGPEESVRELTAHKCRHTYATYLLKGGANLRQVQQLLGHSSVVVTEIYTHIDTDDVKNSVTKLPY